MRIRLEVSRKLVSGTGMAVQMGWILGLLVALSSTAWAQEPDETGILAQMAVAMRSLDYQGSFVYRHSGRIDTLRVFHAGGSREQERLISLNGARTELIRNGANITCIQPDDSAIVYTSASGRGLLPLVPDAADPKLAEFYAIANVGSDRVAGYEADIVEVRPRDGYRYGYRLWLERGTRLLLRSIVVDHTGHSLEEFMFVALDIGTAPADTDLLPRQRELLTTTAAPRDEIDLRGPPAWQVLKAPAGFAFRSARSSASGATGAQHLVYSDGLASVSIYIETSDSTSEDLTTMAGRGTLNIYTYGKDKWRFTVLGNVPVATVTAIAQSIVPFNSPATSEQ